MLAQMLSEEGLVVDFERPLEGRTTAAQVAAVVLLYVASKVGDKAFDVSVDKLIERAVERFKKRVPNAEVTVKRRQSSTDGSE